VGAVSISADLKGFVHSVEHASVPLGVLLVAVVVIYALYRARGAFRRWAINPYRPRVEGGGPAVASKVVRPRPIVEEGELPPEVEPEPPAPPEPAAPSSSAPEVPAFVPTKWTLAGGVEPLPYHPPPETVASIPSPSRAFGQTLAIEFTIVVALILLLHAYFFAGVDRLVELLGRVTYWPLGWPGVITHVSLRRSLPDLIFIVYIAMMLAFCLAARIFTDPRITTGQRRWVVMIFASYCATEILFDVFLFTISGRFSDSASLLLRSLTGGIFFTGILLVTLVFPPPIQVARRFPRARSAIGIFFGTGLLSIALATLLLFFLYRNLGIGRSLIPFAVLLLIPVTALTIWGVMGRGLYELELRRRPLPSVAQYHPRVTIVIPAYNEQSGIAAAIRSADRAAGLYPGETEIIVGNDGSTDATLERAREAMGLLRHATGAVLDLPHGGKSNALNGALSAATGEVVVRIDADARISTSLGFSEIVPHFADPEVGGVQGLILPLQQEGWTRKLRFMEIAWNHLFLRRAMMATRSTQVVDGAFCAFRRADLVSMGGWVAWNGEDTEITLRIQRMGYRTRFETRAAAFEDVPGDYASLRKQRIRWNRGGLFAHRRHFGALFGDAFEFGGLSVLLWLGFFVRGGVRTLIWAYAILATVILGFPTIFDVLVIAGILLIPRGIAIGYYLIKFGRWRFLVYLPMWPVAGTIKQFFAMESFGSMLPGASPEFAE
jgi:cellulose synthase/poly-beta-1,6-N-acetylglucosamine synthase-like glycosyltransferase